MQQCVKQTSFQANLSLPGSGITLCEHPSSTCEWAAEHPLCCHGIPCYEPCTCAGPQQPSTNTKRIAQRWIWTRHPLLGLGSNRQAQALFVSRLAASVSLDVPGVTPESSPHHSSHTITDLLKWSILGFGNSTHLVCFTLPLAGALGIHPEVRVHVVGADARMGVSNGWQR